MRITIDHQMSITPPAGTAHAVLHLLLTPTNGPTQQIEDWTVEMAGIESAAVFADAYGNTVHLVNQSRPEGTLVVRVSGTVVTTDRAGVLGRPGGEPVPALYKRTTPLTKASVTLYGKFRGSKDSRIDVLHALMARVGETLGVDSEASQSQMSADGGRSQSQSSGASPAETAPPTASALVHLFIGGARALDIPARYVTGYVAAEPDGDDDLVGFHAWAEAYDEALGWIGFDPLLQICPSDRHVRLAVGLDESSTVPIRVVPAGDGVTTIAVSVETVG
ncbi:transglutaminase family protein [Devosia beringensis]|uniref:transglutaminase family protein n=1 Tax=Devosia beringensis TaxID=2657486 RepID=UPI00186B8B91|nr:transglutaminase family protein [Devosia beringensis]